MEVTEERSCFTVKTRPKSHTCWAVTCSPQRSVAAVVYVFYITFTGEKKLTAVLLKSKQFAQGYLERRSIHSWERDVPAGAFITRRLLILGVSIRNSG